LEDQLAFIDEFGNFGYEFDKQNVTTHFIITATIVDKNDLNTLESKIEPIRKKHFQAGEMKSSKVGNNDDRRIRILKDLSELDFYFLSFVIDKRKLYSEGLKYKRSFYKFLHGLVESKLYKTFPKLKITADELGSKEFMTAFIEHVKRRHIPDLFNYSEFGFVKSRSSLLIQLSDFIGGTIAKAFDETVYSKRSSVFIEILKNRIIEIDEWPRDFKPFTYRYEEQPGPGFSPLIAQQSINLAKIFIENIEKEKDPSRIDQISCLKFLLFHISYINYDEYLSTSELIQNLQKTKDNEISQHYFRSQIIAKLRDEGVLIASSPKGYKLPTSESDLYDFVNQTSQVIKPMLIRLEKCRKQIRLASKTGLDILEREEFKYLKNFFDG
jgi:biotin operon repressor